LPMTGAAAILVSLPPLVMWCVLQFGERAARKGATV